MLTVSKQCTFDAAHILTNYDGKCKNLHGHTYRLIVSVGGDPDKSNGMVIDFKALKQVVEDVILARFDHAFLYNENSPVESEIAAVISKHSMRSVALPCPTTVENLTHFIFGELAKHIAVSSVTLYETPDSFATLTR